DLPLRMLIPCIVSLVMIGALQLYLTRSFIGRAILAVSQDPLALQLMAASPTRIKQIAFGISTATCAIAGTFLIIIQPVEPAVGLALIVLTRVFFSNEYFFFAAYVVLQYVVLSTAWNILGGYTGYINFGTGAFFAIGAYSSVVLHNLHAKPALLQDLLGMTIPAIPLPV